MTELVDWCRKEEGRLHPICLAAKFRLLYETIHPFLDGNGRTGRLLLNFLLVRAGFWPVNIRYGDDRQAYYGALETWHQDRDLGPMTALLAAREIEQLEECCRIADQLAEAEALRTQSQTADTSSAV